MRRPCWLLFLFVLLSSSAHAGRVPGAAPEEKLPVDLRAEAVLMSSGTASGLAARETAGPDTFCLYGGPNEPTQGKFQLANGTTPDWGGGNGLPGGYGGGPDAWTPVDLTWAPVYWHQSTFNAENLNDRGPGNQALWCGVAEGSSLAEGYVSPPGLGNNWFEVALYESEALADPSVGQEVQLEFFFNYDLQDETWDFFEVEYDSAGTWTTVLSRTGLMRDENDEFPAPGLRFSVEQEAPILFTGNDYGGWTGDRIRIRLLVRSDGAWSDEDGFAPTVAGAAQVDDITLTTSQGTYTEDFEGPGPYLFEPQIDPFVGDFADVYPRLTDIDPCRENETPAVGFIDYDQTVRNGPGYDGRVSTGGSIQLGIEYGIPGNYVVNPRGGLGFGYLSNEVWSPEILLDLPGPEDDAPEFSGVFARWDVWAHLPLANSFFYVWHVRSAMPGQPWSEWQDRNFVYYGRGTPQWLNDVHDLSDLVPTGAERMQLALGVWQWHCDFCWPGSTPSPVFDNVAVYKYRLPGPVLSTRTIDLAQDGFPVSGSIDASTPAARDALDIPFSMARDISTGVVSNVPGDSVTVNATSIIGAASLADIRMIWALKTNALFEDALRTAPASPQDENVVAGPSGTIWTGEVVASAATRSSGAVVPDRYYADLPDADFMYPGDVLHYYFQATDSEGRTSTLPHDTSGFLDFGTTTSHDRSFTVRGLPTIEDAAGSQPQILVIDDSGRPGVEAGFRTSLGNLGYLEGVHYDTYTVQGPASGVSNGIGSAGAHGATGAQLAGYAHMFYFAGDLGALLLSNGTDSGSNDKGDDIGALEDWHALSGTRNIAYFGDNIATALTNDSFEGAAYLASTMGVDHLGPDVREAIGGQLTPVVSVSPYGSTWFTTEFVANGGCLSINQFDQVQPRAGAQAGHHFLAAGGAPITDPAAGVASVIHPTANGIDITFPYSIMYIHDVLARDTGVSSRTQLFAGILGLFAAAPGGLPVEAPEARDVSLSTFPNPFNPSTTVRFTAALGSRGSVKVYNLRGELVRTLHDGEFQAREFTWDGTDTRGALVASGVYIVRAENEGKNFNAKVALVK